MANFYRKRKGAIGASCQFLKREDPIDLFEEYRFDLNDWHKLTPEQRAEVYAFNNRMRRAKARECR